MNTSTNEQLSNTFTNTLTNEQIYKRAPVRTNTFPTPSRIPPRCDSGARTGAAPSCCTTWRCRRCCVNLCEGFLRAEGLRTNPHRVSGSCKYIFIYFIYIYIYIYIISVTPISYMLYNLYILYILYILHIYTLERTPLRTNSVLTTLRTPLRTNTFRTPPRNPSRCDSGALA